MIKLWRFLSVSIVLAVCLGMVLVPGTVSATPDVDCWLEIDPAVTEVGFGEPFDVNVMFQNPTAQDISAIMSRINYTPSLVEVTSVDIGAAVGSPFTITLAAPSWNNTEGWLDYDAGCPLGTTTNMTSCVFATLHMKSKDASGTADIEFVAVDSFGYPEAAIIDTLAEDHLDWGKVVNGTVRVGWLPGISVSPHKLTFSAVEEGEKPPDQTLEVCNSGTDTLDWALTDTADWLSESPTSGSIGEDQCEDVTVSVDVTGMEAGDYSATITIAGSGEVQVPVSLHVESAGVPIPVEPANLSASSLSISPQQVKPGEEVTISANVANTGGEAGDYNAVLYINGAVEDSQTVSVDGGTSENVIFTVSRSQAGVYDVSLGGQSGQFEVVHTGWFSDGLGTGGIIAIVAVVIVLIVVLFFMLRGRRRET
jgi:hypothetical protein